MSLSLHLSLSQSTSQSVNSANQNDDLMRIMTLLVERGDRQQNVLEGIQSALNRIATGVESSPSVDKKRTGSSSANSWTAAIDKARVERIVRDLNNRKTSLYVGDWDETRLCAHAIVV